MNTRCCYYCVHRQKEIRPERTLRCMIQDGKEVQRDSICFAWKWRFPQVTEDQFKEEYGEQ